MNRPEKPERLTEQAHPHASEGAARVLSHAEIKSIYAGLVLSMFLAALNQSIVATALPSIGQAFNDVESLSWVVTGYLLTATVAAPLYGKLSDIYGRRTVMLAAIGVFLVGSIVSAVATSMPMLIAGRVLQGLGGGGLVPLVQSTVADIVAPRERGKYQAYISVVWVTASVAGPVVGGFFSEYIHWSAIFWLNLPFGLLGAALTHQQLKKLPRYERRHKLDLLGAGLMMVSALLLLLALSWGGTRFGWLSPQIIGLMVASGVLAHLFAWRNMRAPEPFLPLTMLRNQVVRMGIAANAGTFGAQLSLGIYIPVYFQLVHQLSATESGIAMVPAFLMTTPASMVAGQVMMRMPRYKWFATSGMSLAVASTALLVIWPNMPLMAVVVVLALMSTGVGALFSTATVSIQNAVTRDQVGTVTGTIAFFRQLVGALLIALMGAILLAGLGFSASRGGATEAAVSATLGSAGAPAEVFRWVFAVVLVTLSLSLAFWLAIEEKPLAGGDRALD